MLVQRQLTETHLSSNMDIKFVIFTLLLILLTLCSYTVQASETDYVPTFNNTSYAWDPKNATKVTPTVTITPTITESFIDQKTKNMTEQHISNRTKPVPTVYEDPTIIKYPIPEPMYIFFVKRSINVVIIALGSMFVLILIGYLLLKGFN